jgi:DNA topoisomerase-1
VQSVALRLVSEREEAVQLFVPDEYWTIEADFSLSSSSNDAATTLPAKLVEVDGQKLSQLSIKSQQQAQELVQRLWQQQQQQQQQQQEVWYTVRSVVKRPVRRNPPPPLVTSTLQQEAARRLGFGASKTMQVAQQLYEGADTGGAVGVCVNRWG